ncbi:thiamine diphosphokinase [Virgibacillus proomii]|uniref:thiamine diphosphokinase n=1 Tax=Virgibacillus proomii TaxID=84407 RepID=UPI001C10C1E7|nr:thiamine diphosphokinase [Virgibacillus proomii]MBU5266062.1 thiamine diphosphokinase [Virgibacillus proomii]
MSVVAIVANGPNWYPDFYHYQPIVDYWIGADRGALTLVEHDLTMEYAVGDFDSTTDEEKNVILNKAKYYQTYPAEKNETDLEIALMKAYELNPKIIYLFGVTGGRMDHALINVQLLYRIVSKGIRGIIVDKTNYIELTLPGKYTVKNDANYPIVSFIPFSSKVVGITLENFYYPLINATISWGSTLCISNKLIKNSGTFSYKEGILLLVKSRDAISG